MKLSDHVEHIRQLIDKSFRNRLGRMGITPELLHPVDNIPAEYHKDRNRMKDIRETFISETGTVREAYEKLVEELTFTLFNRIAALKVMEAHVLHPEIITRRAQHGGRSFAHFLWLEENPAARHEEQEGLVNFIEEQLSAMADDIPLFNPEHPYHLLPTSIELNNIIYAFNQVEVDPQVENDIWKSDDVLGWLYESYNNYKKAAHKASGEKTEYNKVSIQSQVYTPRWVVKFLVDNSLGKMYLEMYPDSPIKEKYKIANAPTSRCRERKPLTEIGMIDPATGSGNFLLYGFDLFYDLYIDQIENYGAEYERDKIPELIIHYNLHGIDLDDRAIQLAQLGLYIKAKRRHRIIKIDHFNVVSSDFFLPDYEEVRHLFENGNRLNFELESIVKSIWADLQLAYKFGSLIRLDETFKSKVKGLIDEEKRGQTLFSASRLADYNNFREEFMDKLHEAVEYNTQKQGLTFLNIKTSDAITFLRLLTRKYDVAVANPPYTANSDFGPKLKKFIDANYSNPLKFNPNLYATFVKRSFEILNEKGKMALIHPLTFMYIYDFKDLRRFILENLFINVFVDYGLSNLFGGVMADPAFYVFEKEQTNKLALFISLDQYTRTPEEKYKQHYCLIALEDYINNQKNKHNYLIDQSKLKIIDGWPFIYWISDDFREKFRGSLVRDIIINCQGLATTNNNKYLRFWWETFEKFHNDSNKWFLYAKGGPYKKWYGNLWCVVNFMNNGYEIKEEVKRRYPYLKGNTNFVVKNEAYYFKEGITYSASGSKGVSYRYMPDGCIFDVGGSAIFSSNKFGNLNYILALFNSKLIRYAIDCLNPTVNTQAGDIERVPFIIPNTSEEHRISILAERNIEIKKWFASFDLVETTFKQNPLLYYTEATLREKLLSHLNYENYLLSEISVNEAMIDQLVYSVYELNPKDRLQVETKMGKSIAELPIIKDAKEAYLIGLQSNNDSTKDFINSLIITEFDEQEILKIKSEFINMYQANYDLEEFCIRHQVNPINVWYWFRESKPLPPGRAHEISLEFVADACRTILMEDEDGIIPLVGLPGEPRLLDRLEQDCYKQGLNSAQFMQLDGLLGRPLNEYLEHHFFKNLSDHLNLFMYLPKTPFIWHLSSGEYQGFEAYIIIYKWTRDSLYKLKTHYLSKRLESLEFRLIQLKESDSAQAQLEKELIPMQLQEIEKFTEKIEELIADGYDPKLDDGVGKNIAPLQKKGLLRCEVLNAKQLEKYLNADW